MKILSGSKNLVIRIVADTFNADRKIKQTTRNVDILQKKAVSTDRAYRSLNERDAWGGVGWYPKGHIKRDLSTGLGIRSPLIIARPFQGSGIRMNRSFTPSSGMVNNLAGAGGKVNNLAGAGGMVNNLAGAGGKAGFFGPGGFKGMMKNIAESGGSVTAAFKAIPAPVKFLSVALFGLGKVLNGIVKMGVFVEGRMTQIEVLTGSAAKSRQLTKEAIKYSIITPFSPSQVFAATSTAVQFGFKDVYKKGAYGLGKDKSLADIAAGLGSVPDLSGKMMGMDRMMNAIMRGDYRLLRPVRGMVQPAYAKAKATGHKVGTPGFNKVFVESLGKIPAIMNLAEKQSNTVAGLWSTIAGFADDFWIAISGVAVAPGVITFWSQLRSILKDIRDVGLEMMDYLQPFFVELGALLGAPFMAVWEVIRQIGKTFGPLFVSLGKIAIQFNRIVMSTIVFGLKLAVRLVVFLQDIVMVVLNRLNAMFGIMDKTSSFVETITEFVAGLQALFQLAMMIVKLSLDMIVLKFKTVLDGWGKVTDKIKGVFPTKDKGGDKPKPKGDRAWYDEYFLDPWSKFGKKYGKYAAMSYSSTGLTDKQYAEIKKAYEDKMKNSGKKTTIIRNDKTTNVNVVPKNKGKSITGEDGDLEITIDNYNPLNFMGID